MAKLLNGKKTSEKILNRLSDEVAAMTTKPRLDIVLAGDDFASRQYVDKKRKMGELVGIHVAVHEFDYDEEQDNVIEVIKGLNSNDMVNGIMVQLPLPEGLDRNIVLNTVDERKDVDGLSFASIGKLFSGVEGFVAATAMGIVRLLDEYEIGIAGKRVGIIGRGVLVGIPCAGLFLRRDASVTIVHSKSIDACSIARECDIVISAVGSAGLVDEKWIKKGAVVVDAGTSKSAAGKAVGDVNFEAVEPVASYITPVPGGVGPMTVACLLENVVAGMKK